MAGRGLTASLIASKFVATGNDFLFIDERVPNSRSEDRPELVRALCDRHWGVGADGVVFVENSKTPGQLKWDFYNRDGSPAEMCGNASRCMGRWAEINLPNTLSNNQPNNQPNNLSSQSIRFETVAGVVEAKVLGEEIEVFLSGVKATSREVAFEVVGRKQVAHFINTGVPHFVLAIPSIATPPNLKETVSALRFHPTAGAGGANVTFLELHGAKEFAAVTFERGVEDFTLSCGTGVVAAAAVGLRLQNSNDREANIETPGGRLSVEFSDSGAVLRGPAEFLFEVRIDRWRA